MGREEQQRYRTQSLRYLENAWRFLKEGEADKAGEFLWGSMAEAIMAAAAGKDVKLVNHRQVLHYGRSIAKEHQDERLLHALHTANSLHGNFYEVSLGPEDMWPQAEEVRATLDRLLGLLPTS